MSRAAEVSVSARPVSVRSLVTRFALAGFIALVVVAIVTAFVSRRVGTDQAINDAKRVTWVSVEGIVAPALDEALLQQDRQALERLDRRVRDLVLRGSLIRVKIWDATGTIVYSDEPRLIGERFELGADEVEVLGGAPAVAEVSDLSEPENRFETESELLEVYQGTETTGGTPLLFEAYFRYSGVSDAGRQLWAQFAPISIGALIALQLVQIPFAWRLARRLRTGQRDRERLLRHAIEASDAERRRIASDLHDGVVQDLAGVSLGLAALGRSPQVEPDRVLDASSSIRTSIKSLRSLLVEIYPPNLHEEGLEFAVGDLLSHLSSRGIEAHLDADLDGHVPDPESAALLYRTAQEALRNIVAHSQANTVRVELRATEDDASITIDDDGEGFASADVEASKSRGHVGLLALSGLLSDAGGRLDVLSTPGAGSRVSATLPRRVEVHS